ncbi:hypothetical protein EYF80_024343 [Liparis tanakae]|uniref:Uncharacterized protein n=1 Tax=Liparis tanakae TaxID=230148 RepID=A0A4Z2HKD3_9TELE|nr:hypothetical protein EYF80_024343 [Liparis tanakae]
MGQTLRISNHFSRHLRNLHAIIEVASEQMADRQMWKQAVRAEPCVRLLGGEELPDLQELVDEMPARVSCPQPPEDVIHAAKEQWAAVKRPGSIWGSVSQGHFNMMQLWGERRSNRPIASWEVNPPSAVR